MHARQVDSFDSLAHYLRFVTSVQRAVHFDGGSSSDDGNKDAGTKKKLRSLITTTGGRRTPKDLFLDSPLTNAGEWPEERDRCVFDFNKVRCPYGEKCKRNHANTPKSSSSTTAADGSTTENPSLEKAA